MNADPRISRIETLWSMVRNAHDGSTMGAQSAQQQLLDRYGTAIRRYLLGAVRNQDVADELYQEFAFRFLKGDYASADADRGKFRSFLKTILYRLVAEHHRKRSRSKELQMNSQSPEPVAQLSEKDEEFTEVWCDELLKQAWNRLSELEKTTGKPFYTVMRTRVEEPDLKSPELAARVSEKLHKEISPANIRVLLHRARDSFADSLIAAVADSVESNSTDRIEEELEALGLLGYCKAVLDKRRDDALEGD